MITLQINQHMMMQYFVEDSGCENMFFFGLLETYQAVTTTSPNELTQPIKKVYLLFGKMYNRHVNASV